MATSERIRDAEQMTEQGCDYGARGSIRALDVECEPIEVLPNGDVIVGDMVFVATPLGGSRARSSWAVRVFVDVPYDGPERQPSHGRTMTPTVRFPSGRALSENATNGSRASESRPSTPRRGTPALRTARAGSP